MFPGKCSWLAEGYWHMLLEAIWDGVSRDGPVSVLFSWRDCTRELEKLIRRGFFFFFFFLIGVMGLIYNFKGFWTPLENQSSFFFFFWPDNYAFNVWNLKERICPWLAKVEFYAKRPNLQLQIYLSSVRKQFFFELTISFRTDNYAFERVKRSEFVNLPGRHWIFCQQDRHTGTPAILGHTSSPSIVGQFSISCQFWLVNALEVRFLSIKKLPSISETQRSFTAFSAFR